MTDEIKDLQKKLVETTDAIVAVVSATETTDPVKTANDLAKVIANSPSIGNTDAIAIVNEVVTKQIAAPAVTDPAAIATISAVIRAVVVHDPIILANANQMIGLITLVTSTSPKIVDSNVATIVIETIKDIITTVTGTDPDETVIKNITDAFEIHGPDDSFDVYFKNN